MLLELQPSPWLEFGAVICFLGDVHGRFDHVLRLGHELRPAAMVFLGDLEPQRPLLQELAPLLDAGIEVRWIRGNHDTDTARTWEHLAGAMHLNIDGQVCQLDGLRVAGLGGVFRTEIWNPDPANPRGSAPLHASHSAYSDALLSQSAPPRPPTLLATEGVQDQRVLTQHSSIFWDVYASLWEQSADILVTHEAPSCHPRGYVAIDELAQSLGVRTLFHGHHHDSLDYRSWDAKLGFRAFGVGLCGACDQQGATLQAGQLDHARGQRIARG